jgi:hypothetical protein
MSERDFGREMIESSRPNIQPLLDARETFIADLPRILQEAIDQNKVVAERQYYVPLEIFPTNLRRNYRLTGFPDISKDNEVNRIEMARMKTDLFRMFMMYVKTHRRTQRAFNVSLRYRLNTMSKSVPHRRIPDVGFNYSSGSSASYGVSGYYTGFTLTIEARPIEKTT